MKKNISRSFKVNDKPVFVLDGLFQRKAITNMEVFLSNASFFLSDYDTENTKQNRHWKLSFAKEEVDRITLLRALHSIAVKFFKSNDPQLRVAQANLHMYGDFQTMHSDSRHGVTVLYYANSNWEENWMGETVFYNNKKEPLFMVAPKPGRVVVFRGDILHRAGVPSRECFKPRLSIALKYDFKRKVKT